MTNNLKLAKTLLEAARNLSYEENPNGEYKSEDTSMVDSAVRDMMIECAAISRKLDVFLDVLDNLNTTEQNFEAAQVLQMFSELNKNKTQLEQFSSQLSKVLENLVKDKGYSSQDYMLKTLRDL